MERLERLVADTGTLETLPERTLLMENMREHGLGELLADLADARSTRRRPWPPSWNWPGGSPPWKR